MAAVFIIVALQWGGSTLGSICIRLEKNIRMEFLERAVTEQNFIIRLLTDKEVHVMTGQDISALADATIRFEFFPRSDDVKAFIEISAALPEEVTTHGFEFRGRDLIITCMSKSLEDIEDFAQRIEDIARFRETNIQIDQNEKDFFYATIYCLAA